MTPEQHRQATLAREALTPGNYRAEFVRLVQRWQQITAVAVNRN